MADETNSSEEINELRNSILELDVMVSGLRRTSESLASLTIDENFKNFYDWKVKPSVDMIALLSSAASNTANVATLYSTNVYSSKSDVKKALKISEKILDEVEVAIKLYKVEIEYLLKASGVER